MVLPVGVLAPEFSAKQKIAILAYRQNFFLLNIIDNYDKKTEVIDNPMVKNMESKYKKLMGMLLEGEILRLNAQISQCSFLIIPEETNHKIDEKPKDRKEIMAELIYHEILKFNAMISQCSFLVFDDETNEIG